MELLFFSFILPRAATGRARASKFAVHGMLARSNGVSDYFFLKKKDHVEKILLDFFYSNIEESLYHYIKKKIAKGKSHELQPQ